MASVNRMAEATIHLWRRQGQETTLCAAARGCFPAELQPDAGAFHQVEGEVGYRRACPASRRVARRDTTGGAWPPPQWLGRCTFGRGPVPLHPPRCCAGSTLPQPCLHHTSQFSLLPLLVVPEVAVLFREIPPANSGNRRFHPRIFFSLLAGSVVRGSRFAGSTVRGWCLFGGKRLSLPPLRNDRAFIVPSYMAALYSGLS